MWPRTSSNIAYWAYWLPRATASLDFERNPPMMAYREIRVERKTMLILALNLIGTPQLASVLLILNRDHQQKQEMVSKPTTLIQGAIWQSDQARSGPPRSGTTGRTWPKKPPISSCQTPISGILWGAEA